MRFFAEFTLERSEGLRMTPPTSPPPFQSSGKGTRPHQGGGINRKNGFSLLEMVIAIFIIAVVLAFSLIAMGKGMGVSTKSSDLTIATAIAEQEMAWIKNIPFPPTTHPGQSYPIEPPPPAPNLWQNAPSPYNNDFRLNATCRKLQANYTAALTDDETMLREITVSVCRKRDNVILVTFHTYIARNGTI